MAATKEVLTDLQTREPERKISCARAISPDSNGTTKVIPIVARGIQMGPAPQPYMAPENAADLIRKSPAQI